MFPNRNLRSSKVYNPCQKILLKIEINIKKRNIKQHSLELNSVTYVHFFLNTNNKKLRKAKSIQIKKPINLVVENSNLISKTLHDPEEVIFNFCCPEFSDEKLLFSKYLQISIPPKKFGLCRSHFTFRIII